MEGVIHVYKSEQIGSDPVTQIENPNGKVNYEKLDIEISTSLVKGFVRVFQNGTNVLVQLDPLVANPTEQDKDDFFANKLILDQVIFKHDGREADINQDKINARTIAFNRMVQMAIYHPLLNEIETNAYLTAIDNWKNAFLTDGISANIIAKITQDTADATHPQHTFLNTIVSVDGATTAQFLISEIIKI